ncbi:hypothetical protein [Nocardia goodfellowii]|uniref:Uncharacterized protein n=1 Tax=Nocardia goodfellowii TaxID=882446 RepID=A0ABS4QF01_9NOCA|nr:hypothetical protein [Nocardia goodfellowii]MBP2189266.1 hypothetical protein [Nocardia goodfellowii]
MGIMGELFGGQKPADEGSEDSNGQVRPGVELDLDAGVIRVSRARAADGSEPATG